MTAATLTAQIKALEAQWAVLKAQAKSLSALPAPRSFADLYGILSEKVDTSEEEIESVQYKFDWEGRRER
jgi:hypothetical protein